MEQRAEGFETSVLFIFDSREASSVDKELVSAYYEIEQCSIMESSR